MESGGGSGEFLPPEPPGPEPELAGAPPREPPQSPQPNQQAWQQPPAAWQQAPPPGWQPMPWGYAPAPSEPDNGAAVAGFVTSLAAGTLLLMSFGFLGALTLIAAPVGIYFSRKGKRAVAEGQTRKHAGLAQAGFVIGIVVLVLSVLAVAGLIVLIVTASHHSSGGPGGGGGFTSDILVNPSRLA